MNLNTSIVRQDGDYLNDQYTATTTCRECEVSHEVKIPGSGLFAYNNGAAVLGYASYFLTVADRELFFVTGICGPCWDLIFPDED
jgi:hypothetical protein